MCVTLVLLYIVLDPPPLAPSEEATYALTSLTGLYSLSNVLHDDNSSITYVVQLTTNETNTTSYFWVVSSLHIHMYVQIICTCVHKKTVQFLMLVEEIS